MTSSNTQESTSVAGTNAATLLGTEQRHDLVSTHASDLPAGSSATQPPDQSLTPALRPLGTDDLQSATHLDDLDLITRMQGILRPQMRRDGHLTLAIQHHEARLLPSYPVLLLPRNTTTTYPRTPELRPRDKTICARRQVMPVARTQSRSGTGAPEL